MKEIMLPISFKGNPETRRMPEIKNIFANIDISKEAYGSKDNGYC
jgi:hypothetical protein